MIPTGLEVEMRIPVAGGRWQTIIFDLDSTPDFAPLLKSIGAGMAHSSAPIHLKTLKENGAGAPLLHSAPLPSHEWRKPSPSRGVSWPKKENQKSLSAELDEVRELLAERAGEIADIDTKLFLSVGRRRRFASAFLARITAMGMSSF